MPEVVGNLDSMGIAVADVGDMDPDDGTNPSRFRNQSVDGLFRNADYAAAGRFVVVGDRALAFLIGNRCVGRLAEGYGERLVRFVERIVKYGYGYPAGQGTRIDGERAGGSAVVAACFGRAVACGVDDRYGLIVS